MKKKTLILLLAAVFVFAAMALVACQPAAMEDVEGTYELQTFTRSYPDAMPETEEGEEAPEQTYTTHDYVKEVGIKAYLVVKKDGSGYYVYSDNETALRAHAIKITFSKDSNDSGKISMVDYTEGATFSTGVSRAKDDIPGYGKESLYVNAKHDGVTLTRSHPIINGTLINRNYRQEVTYKRVSSATDLSYVNQKLNATLRTPEYELQGLDGTLVRYGCYSEEDCEYIYYVVDFDALTKTADVYYALKENGVDVVERGVTVTTAVTEENGSRTLSITLSDTLYSAWYTDANLPTAVYYQELVTPEEGEPYYSTQFGLSRVSSTAEEFIETQKEEYESWQHLE